MNSLSLGATNFTYLGVVGSFPNLYFVNIPKTHSLSYINLITESSASIDFHHSCEYDDFWCEKYTVASVYIFFSCLCIAWFHYWSHGRSITSVLCTIVCIRICGDIAIARVLSVACPWVMSPEFFCFVLCARAVGVSRVTYHTHCGIQAGSGDIGRALYFPWYRQLFYSLMVFSQGSEGRRITCGWNSS